MIFLKKRFSYELESGLLAKQFHKAILIHRSKHYLRESESEMFLQESEALPWICSTENPGIW